MWMYLYIRLVVRVHICVIGVLIYEDSALSTLVFLLVCFIDPQHQKTKTIKAMQTIITNIIIKNFIENNNKQMINCDSNRERNCSLSLLHIDADALERATMDAVP